VKRWPLTSNPCLCAQALRFLSNYVKEHKIQGYHGPIINLFECNERYNTAVEQAGGARMFNAVVENEEVASKLVEALMKSKAGRMQFLPLSKLRPEIPKFPDNASNAQPLSKCLKYDHKVIFPAPLP
jgi:structural maintenance of chromosome 3 (chondroitin sulfate proteoglycan 6)